MCTVPMQVRIKSGTNVMLGAHHSQYNNILNRKKGEENLHAPIHIDILTYYFCLPRE
jgi:hypothetical protein